MSLPTCPVHPGTLLLRRSADGSLRCIHCTDALGRPKPEREAAAR